MSFRPEGATERIQGQLEQLGETLPQIDDDDDDDDIGINARRRLGIAQW